MQSTCRLAGSWTEGPSHCQRSRIVATLMLRSSFMRKSQVASRWLSRRTQQSRCLQCKLSTQELLCCCRKCYNSSNFLHLCCAFFNNGNAFRHSFALSHCCS